MRKRYDLSKGRPNPYAKRLEKQATIRLDEETIHYFKGIADETAILTVHDQRATLWRSVIGRDLRRNV